ncbi:hypothetical protein MNBD_GAMMA03-471 [hydrothermal vent metagenome]|uniref:Sulfatase N-terminal domain-containing protein n=1 Tax=hydrothermal vent metagenome TaxID=652676 RepID=A0A3B0WDQ6_9ZZZZ
MINIKKLKCWILEWVLSESLRRTIRLRRLPFKLQKLWLGTPSLPAPVFEQDYFSKENLSSSIIRRMDDYRAAAIIKKRAEVSLEGCLEYSTIQLAITPEHKYDSKPGRMVKLKIGDKETCIKDILCKKWFDVRLDFHTKSDKLIIETDVPIAMTMPRGIFCSPEKTPKKKARHIIILVLDAWTTAMMDKGHPFTGQETSFPNIKRFFSKGLQAENGVSSGQWTLPAVSSLFTGQHLAAHKMFHPTRWQEFDSNRKTLPEYFQQEGYHTLCGSVVSRITPAFGHSRGFDRFLYHFVDPKLSYEDYNPAVWTQEIIGHLEAHYNDCTFSYFQFPDTHPSWHLAPSTRYFQFGRRGNTSGKYKEMLMFSKEEIFNIPEQCEQLYSLRLAELDRMFGSIFDYVERHFGNEALVAVTADHGLRMPYLNESHENNAPFLTDIRVNIPLYMRGANVPSKVYSELCAPNIDLPKMLLDLAGIKPEVEDFDGINFIDHQRENGAVITEYAYHSVYEIAVRGDDHALFLKYKIDDLNFKLLSKEPIYTALYFLKEEAYLLEDNLINKKPSVVKQLKKIAEEHFLKKGIMGEE